MSKVHSYYDYYTENGAASLRDVVPDDWIISKYQHATPLEVLADNFNYWVDTGMPGNYQGGIIICEFDKTDETNPETTANKLTNGKVVGILLHQDQGYATIEEATDATLWVTRNTNKSCYKLA